MQKKWRIIKYFINGKSRPVTRTAFKASLNKRIKLFLLQRLLQLILLLFLQQLPYQHLL